MFECIAVTARNLPEMLSKSVRSQIEDPELKKKPSRIEQILVKMASISDTIEIPFTFKNL